MRCGSGSTPTACSRVGLTASDVDTALQGQNVQVASGVLNQPPVDDRRAPSRSPCRRSGRLADPGSSAMIVVKSDAQRGGAAEGRCRVELGRSGLLDQLLSRPRSRRGARRCSSGPARTRSRPREAIRSTMDQLAKRFRPGLKYAIVYNPTQFIQQSVDAVQETIGEAIVLVVLVVILFLQTWRAAIIPLVAIPVSLIGTFFLMAALRLLAQQSVAVRPGAGDRHRGRRRHRRGRERRAQHRGRPVAARGGDPQHGRGRLGADRDRAGAVRGVRAVGVHHRHFRPVLPAVRPDDRRPPRSSRSSSR